MHIAFNGWFWDQPHTGSGQYVRHLLPQLARVAPDLQMTLVLPPGLGEVDSLPETISLATTDGSRSNLGKVWFEQRTFPQLAGQVGADIAHVPYWGSPLTSPIPLVTSVLDVIPLALPEYSGGLLPRFYTSLVSATARGSSHVLTLSDAAKADITTYLDIPAEQITATHLAADEAYHPHLGAERDEAVRAKYDLPDQFVLYIGGFDPRKRVADALLAFSYVSAAHGDEYPLVIAGREPQWGTPMFPDLRAYTDSLKVSEFVRWIGYVDEADKPSLYRLANVFVYPSVYEGFGLPVIEAMASGTPVVARDIPVMSEIAGDAAYLVGDARAMGGAIIALLIQEPLRQTQISRGLAQATRFSWRKVAQATFGVYEQVMRL